MKLLIINGPNINLLGVREKHIYGNESYEDLLRFIDEACQKAGVEHECFQSNHEGDIVDKIQQALGVFDGIVITPAAYTHTSVAILDALKAVNLPAVEVHLSDISQREEFRKISYAGMACQATFAGLGFKGYEKAILYLKELVK